MRRCAAGSLPVGRRCQTILYAASAWHGFTKAADRRRINLLLERAKSYGYCMPDLPTFDELCDTADDQLFNKTVSHSSHVLHTALPLPSTASQHYNPRRRTHTLSLPEHFTYLSDCNFIIRMLYKHSSNSTFIILELLPVIYD